MEKGFHGPSLYPLNKRQEESTKHILNTCGFTDSLCNRVLTLFGHLYILPNSVRETLEEWKTSIFKSLVVSRACNLVLEFIY